MILDRSQENSAENRFFEAEAESLRQTKRRSDQKETQKTEVFLENPEVKLGVTGSLLHLLGSCKLRTLRTIRKDTKDTPPTPFAREKFADGREFERELIASPAIWRRLLREQYATPTNLMLFDRKDFKPEHLSGEKLSDHQKKVIEETIAANPGEAILFQQVHARMVDPITGDLDIGVIDLALWKGTAWQLGEIKSNPQPRASTALQLGHYRKIWKEWAPSGDTTSEEVFILHPQMGWEYQCQASKTRRTQCLEAVQISSFDLGASESVHADAMAELHDLHQSADNPAEEVINSPLNHDCSECLHRIKCYERFVQDARHPDGPHVSAAGFDEAEQDWLKADLGITRTRQALARIGELEPLHQQNPVSIAYLKSRLIHAERLYGTFAWAVPHNPQKLVFYGRPASENHPAWMIDDEAVHNPEEKLADGEQFTLVAFTLYEMRKAYAQLLAARRKPAFVLSLQEELQEDTLIPFENLSLFGISQTLQGILEEGSWADYAEKTMIPGMKTHPDRQEIIRAAEVAALWDVMMELHRQTTPNF